MIKRVTPLNAVFYILPYLFPHAVFGWIIMISEARKYRQAGPPIIPVAPTISAVIQIEPKIVEIAVAERGRVFPKGSVQPYGMIGLVPENHVAHVDHADQRRRMVNLIKIIFPAIYTCADISLTHIMAVDFPIVVAIV